MKSMQESFRRRLTIRRSRRTQQQPDLMIQQQQNSNNSNNSNNTADGLILDHQMDDHSLPTSYKPIEGILWSAIARDGTILCEAGEDLTDDNAVTSSAQQLMSMKATPGWEFGRRDRVNGLRSLKFHVFDKDKVTSELRCWKFACVYDETTVARDQAQSFLEKMVILTELPRSSDWDWQHGSTLAVQEAFAPTLLQRMQEVRYMGRLAMVNDRVDEVRGMMHSNIELMLENTEKAEDLQEEATAMEAASRVFKKRAQQVKRFKMWQDAKHGIVIGTAITAGVAVATVPPLIALL